MIAHATLTEQADSTHAAAAPLQAPHPTKPQPAARLVVPRADAAEGLRAVIQRGMEIRKWGIYDFADLETVRAAKQTWTQAYTDLLNTIFDSGAVADECNDWVGVILPEYADVAMFAEQLYKEMSHRLKRLRAVLKRIPTTEDPTAAAGQQQAAAVPQAEVAVAAHAAPIRQAAKPMAAAHAPKAHALPKVAPSRAPEAQPRVLPTDAEPFEVLPVKPAPAPARIAEKPATVPAAAPPPPAEIAARPTPPPVPVTAPVSAPAHNGHPVQPPAAPASLLLVHAGRDATKENVVEFLCDLGIDLVEWDHGPKPAQAQSIDADPSEMPPPAPLVEQFERVVGAAAPRQPSFAVVLLDAHSAAGLQPGSPDPLCGCPRDLLFRLGLLAGLFGKQFCVLYPAGHNAPSFQDAQGIWFLAVGTAEGWQLQLARHLKRAGLDVDLNRLC